MTDQLIKERTSLKDYLITAGWLALAGIVMTFIFYPPTEDRKLKVFVLIAALTSCIWIFLWIGNAATSDLVDRRIDWVTTPVKRFVVGMIVMTVYTLSAIFFLVWIFRVAFNFDVGSGLNDMLYTSLIITFVISLFMHGRGFLRNWRLAELEAEKAKQESIKANYESLKNQVNPHFLFNSLNALTSLVYEDQDKAAKFIKQLSEVYRYVLDTRNREVVPIDEELKFMESYLFLQQIRFGEKLRIRNELAGLSGSVPPLSLQMLVENAIKHNIISQEHPLTIHLFSRDNELVVVNNLQQKLTSEDSSGVGLENIKRRYEFLSNRRVMVEKNQHTFSVKLPILIEEQ